MKRPIFVAVIGYIIGIIMGLYFKNSIVLFYIPFLITTAIIKVIKKNTIRKRKHHIIFSFSRYFRYIKLILNSKVLVTILIFSIISNTIVLFKELKFDNIQKNLEDVEMVGIIKELKKETNYNNIYKVKVINKNIFLYASIDKKFNFTYGDYVIIKGKFEKPQVARNYGGFDYSQYLKTLNIYGTVKVTSIKWIQPKTNGIIEIEKNLNELKNIIKNRAKKILNKDDYSIYLGLILGDTSEIEENIKEQFRDSNMAHILAVSGMHISYIILGMTIFFNKILGKKISKIISILVLVFYSMLAGFSPSLIRACIMGIMVLLAGVIHRKNDIWTSISFSALVILIYNPYLITSVSFQFTYAGTIGIILFNKSVLNILNKRKENKSKIKQVISISISAQLLILPLTVYHFNKLGIYFLITSVLLDFIIVPVIILSFIFLILVIVYVRLAKLVAILLKFFLKLLLLISNLSFMPLSKVYIRTPQVLEILIFYFSIFLIKFIYSIFNKKNQNPFELRSRYMLAVFKYRFRENKKKLIKRYGTKVIATILSITIITGFIVCFFLIKLNTNLRIHFVDVGQGDCCFIETPNNKTILIDGGGSELGNFDVGKSVLIPYILDRGHTRIDYIFISHFDTDHVRTDY